MNPQRQVNNLINVMRMLWDKLHPDEKYDLAGRYPYLQEYINLFHPPKKLQSMDITCNVIDCLHNNGENECTTNPKIVLISSVYTCSKYTSAP